MISGTLNLSTTSVRELVDITGLLARAIRDSGVQEGLLVVYNPHTTAGVTINEGADPDVRTDLVGALGRIVPEAGEFAYRHREGNSPAHMMATLTGSSVTVIIENGALKLGTWQRIFFCEYDGPRSRRVWWTVLSEGQGQ